MAIGRTWQESVQKALRGMETGLDGWGLPKNYKRLTRDQMLYSLRVPNPERFTVGDSCICVKHGDRAGVGQPQVTAALVDIKLHWVLVCMVGSMLPQHYATCIVCVSGFISGWIDES